MSLIAMAVYSTEDNRKDECLERTLRSLYNSVDFGKHRLQLSVNAFTDKTKEILNDYSHIIEKVIYNETNLGTAKAVNKVWIDRKPGEHCIKMDDDVEINNCTDWVEQMENVIRLDPKVGQVGLKRKDCWENPDHKELFYKSELKILNHKSGEPWIVIEKVRHVIGTCVMHNSALIDTIGYLYQPGLYGYDDSLMSHRSYLAKFYSVFIPHIDIDHIDPAATIYQGWKEKEAGKDIKEFHRVRQWMIEKKAPIFYKADY